MIARISKRRRRAATTPAEPDDASSSPWASLHCDLIQLIGWRLLETGGDLLDYVRLRAVSSHWRSSTVSPHGRGVSEPRFHPRRWMMLPEGHGLHPGHGKLRGYVRFINLSTGAIVRVKLPLFRHHCVLDSGDGLLLLQRDLDTAVRLLHPFTGDLAELPPLLTLVKRFSPQFTPDKDDRETRDVWFNFRAVTSTCVSVGADGVVAVMLVIKREYSLAFATTMDHKWTVAADQIISTVVHKPISFGGRLYMLDDDPKPGMMRIVEIEPPRAALRQGPPGSSSSPVLLPPPKLIATVAITGLWDLYLAECDSEILLIGCADSRHRHITVYRLADLVTLGKLVPVTSIGDNILLVSERILSVSSRVLPNVEGGSVVMVHGADKDLSFGQYRLGSSTWLPAADDESTLNRVQSPCSLIYHIFTCCRPALWNKGEICFQGKISSKHWWKVKRKWRHGA